MDLHSGDLDDRGDLAVVSEERSAVGHIGDTQRVGGVIRSPVIWFT